MASAAATSSRRSAAARASPSRLRFDAARCAARPSRATAHSCRARQQRAPILDRFRELAVLLLGHGEQNARFDQRRDRASSARSSAAARPRSPRRHSRAPAPGRGRRAASADSPSSRMACSIGVGRVGIAPPAADRPARSRPSPRHPRDARGAAPRPGRRARSRFCSLAGSWRRAASGWSGSRGEP